MSDRKFVGNLQHLFKKYNFIETDVISLSLSILLVKAGARCMDLLYIRYAIVDSMGDEADDEIVDRKMKEIHKELKKYFSNFVELGMFIHGVETFVYNKTLINGKSIKYLLNKFSNDISTYDLILGSSLGFPCSPKALWTKQKYGVNFRIEHENMIQIMTYVCHDEDPKQIKAIAQVQLEKFDRIIKPVGYSIYLEISEME